MTAQIYTSSSNNPGIGQLSVPSNTGLPSPVLVDDPNVPRDILALTTALDQVTVPKFASTAARDAAHSAGALFMLCFVGDICYRWIAGAWVAWPMPDPPISDMQITRTTNNSIVTSTWTAIVAINTLSYSKGTGLVYNTTGITAVAAGRYLVTGYGWFDNSTAGNKRSISISVGAPSVATIPQAGSPALGVPAVDAAAFLTFAAILTVPAGALIQLWAWQNSGATIFFNNGTLNVRHLP